MYSPKVLGILKHCFDKNFYFLETPKLSLLVLDFIV